MQLVSAGTRILSPAKSLSLCNEPLFAIVDLAAASRTLQRETLRTRHKSLWRYREVLPLPGDVEPVSLGEGGTPLLSAQRLADDVDLWVKDESLNPTHSFKARGMSVAVSMAKHLGATKLAVPSAGNARWRAGRVCRSRRSRSSHFHAARHAPREYRGMPRARRSRYANRRIDH